MSGTRKTLRTFFALWPDDDVRAALADRSGATARMTGGRPTRADALHLTLVFIGATPAARVDPLVEMMSALEVAPFVLRLDRCGWFRANGVAWMGVESPPEPLFELQDALARGASRLGFSLDVRPYVPHLTLARDARRAPAASALAPVDWNVGAFSLVASELLPDGPRYRILHETALAGCIAAAPARA